MERARHSARHSACGRAGGWLAFLDTVVVRRLHVPAIAVFAGEVAAFRVHRIHVPEQSREQKEHIRSRLLFAMHTAWCLLLQRQG